MADTLPTVWNADPHTLAKHAILENYLKAWLPILTNQGNLLSSQKGGSSHNEILYIDGFAGPGEYQHNQPGSPIIALNAALSHTNRLPSPVRMIFIETEPDRYAHLMSVINKNGNRIAQSNKNINIEHCCGDCNIELGKKLDDFKSQKISFGPALAFLDQFGYGDVPMTLISRILQYDACEVFTYLNYFNMNRWITDPDKYAAFSRAFGGNEWQAAVNMDSNSRKHYLHDAYVMALKDKGRGNAKYVVSFSMYDKSGILLYWLFFCTNNIRGLEEMKKAMWKVDENGTFRFSDKDNADQAELFNQKYDQIWLAGELADKLNGKTLTAMMIKEYVLTKTPCYLFKEALQNLEKNDRIKIVKQPAERRKNSYPDDELDNIEILFKQEQPTLFD